MTSLQQLRRDHTNLLLLDSCSEVIWVGLWSGHQAAVWVHHREEAGSGLFRAVDEILQQANLTLPRIDAFLFNEGPGSVLGIRTAAVALRTWQVLGKRPIFAFQGLALMAAAETDSSLSIIADARRNSWHVARKGQSVVRVPTEELSGTCFMPEGYRHWTPLPSHVETRPYDLPGLLEKTAAQNLFRESPEPEAFLHETPSYATWTPAVHQAPQ